MSVGVSAGLRVGILDSNVSSEPNIVIDTRDVATPINCPVGARQDDVALPAGTANAPLTGPVSVVTAAVIIICNPALGGCTDLTVAVGTGPAQSIPLGQCWMAYNVAPGSVVVSTVLGGKILTVVGG